MYIMSDKMNRKWDLPTSISELESVGLETPKLNELNDSYEVENLVENLKQTKDYKSMHVFTDWQIIGCPPNSKYPGHHTDRQSSVADHYALLW